MSWEEVVFESVFKIPTKNGLTKPSRIRGEGFKFINMGELFAIDRMFDPEMELVPLTESEKISHKIEAGDLLFARQSLVASGAGKCSIVKEVDDLTVFDSHIIRVRLNQEQCYPDFYYYYFKSTVNNLKSLVQQGVQAGIKASDLSKLKVHLPPLQTQKRIASILSAYDDLIENNLKRIKLLEETAQNIYKEWFVNFRFPNYENTPINQVTGLPEGWENCRLSEIFDIQGGTQPPKSEWKEIFEDGYVRMIQIRDYYTDAHIAFVKDKPTLKKCTKTDIMIARYGASVGRICWGLEGAYNVALAKVIPIKKSFLSYLRWYLKSDYFQLSLLGMTQRTAQDGFNKETFNSIFATKPDEKTLIQFGNIELNVFLQIEKLKETNQKLKEARDILLPRLMNRTIEV